MINPQKYNKHFHPLLALWISRWGLDDRQIAAELRVPQEIFDEWKKRHQEFAKAIEQGSEYWSTLAEQSLQKLLKGYNYDETTVDVGSDGEATHVRKVTRHVSPNARAVLSFMKEKKSSEGPCPPGQCVMALKFSP